MVAVVKSKKDVNGEKENKDCKPSFLETQTNSRLHSTLAESKGNVTLPKIKF